MELPGWPDTIVEQTRIQGDVHYLCFHICSEVVVFFWAQKQGCKIKGRSLRKAAQYLSAGPSLKRMPLTRKPLKR